MEYTDPFFVELSVFDLQKAVHRSNGIIIIARMMTAELLLPSSSRGRVSSLKEPNQNSVGVRQVQIHISGRQPSPLGTCGLGRCSGRRSLVIFPHPIFLICSLAVSKDQRRNSVTLFVGSPPVSPFASQKTITFMQTSPV